MTEDSTAPAASILCNGAACSTGWYLSSPVALTVAAPDAGAGLDQIRYTTDGSDPTIFEAIATSSRGVDVVVDADAHGTRFIADLVAVFPANQVIALSREPARRTLAIKAGEVLALPRSTTAAQLQKSIAIVATR